MQTIYTDIDGNILFTVKGSPPPPPRYGEYVFLKTSIYEVVSVTHVIEVNQISVVIRKQKELIN